MTAVCIIEAGFRFFSGHVVADALLYTLAARLVEMAVILIFAFRLCGVVTRSPARETSIGLMTAAAFGAAVLAVDLISRTFIPGGLLGLILPPGQPLGHWMSYLLVGCLIGPFVEELFFRGLFYAWMRERLRPELCILLSSLFFASMHGRISLIQFTGGIVFAVLYEWRRNIWAPLVVHVIANIAIWIIPSLGLFG
jgi:membrane protease YdiL (CAAX protease family)